MIHTPWVVLYPGAGYGWKCTCKCAAGAGYKTWRQAAIASDRHIERATVVTT